MPRESVVWQFWYACGRETVRCSYCRGAEQLKHAPKCKKHTLKCAYVPREVKEELLGEVRPRIVVEGQDAQIVDISDIEVIEVNQQLGAVNPQASAVNPQASAVNPLPLRGAAGKNRVSDYVVKLPKQSVEPMQVAFAKAIYSSGASFLLSENYYLAEFMKRMGIEKNSLGRYTRTRGSEVAWAGRRMGRATRRPLRLQAHP